jgi:tetratricopeptide (TPR) repeat protein
MNRTVLILASFFALLTSAFLVNAGAGGKQEPTKQKGGREPELSFEKKVELGKVLFDEALEAEKLGDNERAIKKYNEFQKKCFPEAPLTFYRKGRCFERLNKKEEAIQEYSKFLKADSDDETLVNDAKERLAKLRGGVEPGNGNPQSPQEKYRAGIKLLENGKKDEGVKLLKEFLKADPANVDASDARKRLDDALLFSQLSKAQKRDFDDALDNLHVAIDLGGNNKALQGALKLLTKLNKDVPNCLPISAKLGVAYHQENNLPNACKAYHEYIKGYEKLGYEPEDLVDIKRRLIAADAVLAEEIEKKNAAEALALEKKKAAEIEQKKIDDIKDTLKRLCSLKENDPVFGSYDSKLSFEGDTLVFVYDNKHPKAKFSVKITLRVELRDITEPITFTGGEKGFAPSKLGKGG